MALSAGTYRGRLGDRLYTTEMPRAGEVVSLNGLGQAPRTQYPYQTLTLGQTPGEQPVGGSCGSLGPGYSDKCAGKSYVECLDSAGANTGYRTRCAEAFGVPSWTASMRPASPGIRMAMHVASIAGLTLGAYHGSKRNNGKVWPAIGWGLIGGMFWPVVIPVILAQGVGKR